MSSFFISYGVFSSSTGRFATFHLVKEIKTKSQNLSIDQVLCIEAELSKKWLEDECVISIINWNKLYEPKKRVVKRVIHQKH